MNILPKIKRCPCCSTFNIFRVNGINYDNNFKSLVDWTLKKKMFCKKCKVEFGLFINNKSVREKMIWLDMLKCEDSYLDKLNKLQKNKEKYKDDNMEKKYTKTIKEIDDVLNQIRLDQIKIKVKARIQNKSMLI
jgi:hypothetical protein